MNNLQLSVLLSAIDKMSAPTKNAAKSVNELSSALKTSRGARAQLVKQDKENTASIEKYRTTLNPLKSKLGEINQTFLQAQQKAKHFEQQLANAKNPTSEFKAKVEQAQNAVKKLKTEQTQAAKKLKSAREELQRSGISAGTLGKKQNELRNKLKGANSQIKQQETSLKALNTQQAKYNAYRAKVEKLRDIRGRAQMFGAKTMAVGATIGTAGIAALKPAVDFEQSFSKVQALTRLDKVKDADTIKVLRNQAIELGATTAFTSVEVADAQGYLAMAGFNAQQIKASMPSVLNMSQASGTELARVSDVASDISSGFKIPADQMGRVADVLTLTFTTSNTSLETLYETMKEGAPIMTSLGQSMETTAAMSGLLGNVGIKGSNAGTALKNIGLNMIGNKHLKDLGVRVQDAKGNMRQIPAILADIKKKTDKMGTAQRSDVIKSIFGKIPVASAMELISQADGVLQKYEATLKDANGTVSKVSQIMTDNLAGDIKTLQSAKEALGISVYDTVSESLRALVQNFTMILRKANEWTKAHPELTAALVKFLGVAAGGLTILGALSLILSLLAYPIARIGLGFANLNKIFPKSSGHIKLLTNALMSWHKTGNGALKIAQLLGRWLFKIINPLTYIKGGFNLATGALKGFLIISRFLLTTPLGLMITGLAAGALYIYRNWEKVRAFFGGFWEGLKSGLAPVLEKFKPLADLFSLIFGWIEKAVKWFADLLLPVQSTQKGLDEAAQAGKKFGEWLAAGIDLVTKPLQWVVDTIKWVIDNMPSLESINNAANKAMTQNNSAGNYFMQGLGYDIPQVNKWSGGYAGNGGKYEPKGIFHGGEYIMTKTATSRLGLPLLNALNYGKKTAVASMLGVGVATAQPIKIDNRPPLSAKPHAQQLISQPMQVTININATAGQSSNDIARAIRRELEKLEQQRQAKARSRLYDRE